MFLDRRLQAGLAGEASLGADGLLKAEAGPAQLTELVGPCAARLAQPSSHQELQPCGPVGWRGSSPGPLSSGLAKDSRGRQAKDVTGQFPERNEVTGKAFK